MFISDNTRRKIIDIVTDDEARQEVQYKGVYLLLGSVSAFMTILNIFTHKGALTWATFVFMLLCAVDYLLILFRGRRGMQVSSYLFMGEIVALFIFFIISGNPDGFSAIWIAMLPACGMLLFGLKKSAVLSAVMWLILVFFFWLPAGRSLLRYDYNPTFLMRYPILYVAFFLLSCLLEGIRDITQRELYKMRQKYEYLYVHDALTNLLNRRGLYEWHDKEKPTGTQACMFLDIDHFKRVNDSFGHAVGDSVLANVSKIISRRANTKICRWGGEEFVVWFPKGNLKDSDAEAIRRDVEDMVIHIPDCDKVVRVTISIGVARGDKDMPLDALIRLADDRMYKAKQAGRNRVVYE